MCAPILTIFILIYDSILGYIIKQTFTVTVVYMLNRCIKKLVKGVPLVDFFERIVAGVGNDMSGQVVMPKSFFTHVTELLHPASRVLCASLNKSMKKIVLPLFRSQLRLDCMFAK